MKQSRKIVNEIVEKRGRGRPRSVSDNDLAPAVAVRLPRIVLDQIDASVAKNSMKRSDAICELLTDAFKKGKR